MKINSFSGRLTVFITKYLAYIFFSVLKMTYRYRISGDMQKDKKCIYLLWHQNIIALLLQRTYEGVAIVISSSFDGELIAAPSRLFGYKIIRGSSSRKAVSALREMLSMSKSCSIAVTPDGPKGPQYEIKDGAVYLAYMSKNPIVPVKVVTHSKWQFNSWDKFILPKPFSRIDITYFDPIYVKSKDEIEDVIKKAGSLMR